MRRNPSLEPKAEIYGSKELVSLLMSVWRVCLRCAVIASSMQGATVMFSATGEAPQERGNINSKACY